jgi:hypothetical protein
MQNEMTFSLSRLSDAELVARVKSLAGQEREVTAQLVAHLAELDTREVHFREGYPSLFAYCREVLRLSEHEAYNRIEVARAARRFPVILEQLTEGTVTLTTVRLLAPHLTPQNVGTVLEAARGKRKAEVEEIVARLAPRADVAASIRRLPAARPAPRPGMSTLMPAARPAPLSPPPLVAPQPLSPDRYKLQLTINGETLEKLRLAKDMLRHAIPSGDEAEILDRALTALLAELARRKFAATERPRDSRGGTQGSRHIPAAVRRQAWLRDRGRCAFTAADGRRCAERAFVEFHHRWPYSAGGAATVENIELRCRQHNGHEARTHPATRSGTSRYRERAIGGNGAQSVGRVSTARPVGGSVG